MDPTSHGSQGLDLWSTEAKNDTSHHFFSADDDQFEMDIWAPPMEKASSVLAVHHWISCYFFFVFFVKSYIFLFPTPQNAGSSPSWFKAAAHYIRLRTVCYLISDRVQEQLRVAGGAAASLGFLGAVMMRSFVLFFFFLRKSQAKC